MTEKFEAGHEFNYFRKKYNPKKTITKYNHTFIYKSDTVYCNGVNNEK